MNGLLLSIVSCSKESSKTGRFDERTGIDFSKPTNGGLKKLSASAIQDTPPGMVLVEGGRFTMGLTQQNVMGDYNNKAKVIHVQDFYMDDTEVTNKSYVIYLEWLSKVFPKNNPNYKHIYDAAVPDTTVWRTPLGDFGSLPKTYLRHRAYEDYPVVGVTWIQANDYCKWRTNRVAEKKLMDQGLLKNLYASDSITIEGRNHFDVEVFESNPHLLFNGDYSIYTDYVLGKEVDPKSKKSKKEDTQNTETLQASEKGEIKLRLDKHSPTASFRLPTELEWEYAAKADVENRYFNTIRGRKKYAWIDNNTRDKGSKYYTENANFKQGRGDYKGIAGWTSDFGDITTPVRSYPPNAFGLYDMTGNVAEWVYDIYRPIIQTDDNDFNYTRGNVYQKPKFDKNGKIIVADYGDVKYDTLPNGKIVPRNLPGQLMKEDVTSNDTYLKFNYSQANNLNYKDGDHSSSSFYAEENTNGKRMYNSPIIPKPEYNSETGILEYKYDNKPRTTLISNNSRVYKGGSWKDREFWLDAGQRRFLEEYLATNYIGFRCAVGKLGGVDKSETKKRTPYHN